MVPRLCIVIDIHLCYNVRIIYIERIKVTSTAAPDVAECLFWKGSIHFYERVLNFDSTLFDHASLSDERGRFDELPAATSRV